MRHAYHTSSALFSSCRAAAGTARAPLREGAQTEGEAPAGQRGGRLSEARRNGARRDFNHWIRGGATRQGHFRGAPLPPLPASAAATWKQQRAGLATIPPPRMEILFLTVSVLALSTCGGTCAARGAPRQRGALPPRRSGIPALERHACTGARRGARAPPLASVTRAGERHPPLAQYRASQFNVTVTLRGARTTQWQSAVGVAYGCWAGLEPCAASVRPQGTDTPRGTPRLPRTPPHGIESSVGGWAGRESARGIRERRYVGDCTFSAGVNLRQCDSGAQEWEPKANCPANTPTPLQLGTTRDGLRAEAGNFRKGVV